MSGTGRAYLDAGSGQPMHPAGREALQRALDTGWGDPTRVHHEGRRAALLLEAAAESLATVIGARADEVAFTSSGAAALRRGLAGLLAGRARVSRRVVAGAVEQSTLLAVARYHAGTGGEVVEVGVDARGRVAVGDLVAAATGPVPAAAACLQAANHEIGTLQPVDDAHRGLAGSGVPLLVDATAVAGHTPVPRAWDVLAADAAGWAGPPGVGVLAVRKGTRWRPPGAPDPGQGGLVPGPVPVPLVVAAVAALEAVERERAVVAPRLAGLVDRIRAAVPATVPDSVVVGDPVGRVPHVVTFSCLYVDGEALVHELDAAGVAVGSGSACTSGTGEPSHVLAAMGALTQGNVRVSLPVGIDPDRTEAAVDRLLAVLPGAVARVRDRLGVAGL